MYSNACRNASGGKPTTLHVMRYQGPTWEPWGPRTIVEEGVGLAAPVLHQFVISRRRTTDVAVGKGGSVMWDAEGVQDQSDAPFTMWLVPVQSTCTAGLGNFNVIWDQTLTLWQSNFFFVYVASQSSHLSEVWILAALFRCIICEAAGRKVVQKWDHIRKNKGQ